MQNELNNLLEQLGGGNSIELPFSSQELPNVNRLIDNKIAGLLEQQTITAGQAQVLSILLQYKGKLHVQSNP